MRLEKAMYEAIEKDNPFDKKMSIICSGLDKFFYAEHCKYGAS